MNSLLPWFLAHEPTFASRLKQVYKCRGFNYLIDIYSKWYQNYFYLCQKYKSEHPDRLADEFEVKFVRLKYTGKNQFDFSYFRHTGQWQLVAKDFTLDECKEMILSNPVFQPDGG